MVLKIKKSFPYLPALIPVFFFLCLIILSKLKTSKNNPFLSDQNPNTTANPINSPIPSNIILTYLVITETPIPTRTPTPTKIPTPTIIHYSFSQFEQWFDQYAGEKSVNKDLLKKIAVCESNLNPQAVNGIYAGLYQFSESSWKKTRVQMNQDNNPKLRFDPQEAIKTGAFKLATDGSAAWSNCSK